MAEFKSQLRDRSIFHKVVIYFLYFGRLFYVAVKLPSFTAPEEQCTIPKLRFSCSNTNPATNQVMSVPKQSSPPEWTHLDEFPCLSKFRIHHHAPLQGAQMQNKEPEPSTEQGRHEGTYLNTPKSTGTPGLSATGNVSLKKTAVIIISLY